MQTFLPYADYESIANVLDNRRLNKQIVECQQILFTLFGLTDGYKHHPVVKMWAGYEEELHGYQETLHTGWSLRKYKKTGEPGFHKSFMATEELCGFRYGLPEHLYLPSLLRSHRSQLLGKDFEHYKQFDWHRGPNAVPVGELEYVWPESPHWEEGYER